MIKVHNTASWEVLYGFLCIILSAIAIPLDPIERGLVIDYAVVNDAIDDIFRGCVTGIQLVIISILGDSFFVTSKGLRGIAKDNWCVRDSDR